jgi:excisionase family DNA binding protein
MLSSDDPSANYLPDARLLLRLREVARRLDASLAFVERLVASGELPSVKLRGARRVLAADLEEFVRQLRNAS